MSIVVVVVAGDLLSNTSSFVDKVMDCDGELCEAWSTQTFLAAVLEAAKQIQ